MGYKENYESWLNNPYFDEDTRNELKSIEGNEKEIEDRNAVLPLPMIPVICHRSLQMKRHSVWQQTESKRMYLNL